MTLAEQIAAATSSVFLNTDWLGQAITHYPRGDRNQSETVTAVVELDNEPMAEPPVDDARGAKRVRRGRLWMADTVSVDARERQEARSMFSIDGLLWRAERTIVEDTMSGMQCVYVIREEPIQSNRTRIGP